MARNWKKITYKGGIKLQEKCIDFANCFHSLVAVSQKSVSYSFDFWKSAKIRIQMQVLRKNVLRSPSILHRKTTSKKCQKYSLPIHFFQIFLRLLVLLTFGYSQAVLISKLPLPGKPLLNSLDHLISFGIRCFANSVNSKNCQIIDLRPY